MGNMQKWIGLGLAVAIGVGNAVYAFGPSLKEEAERRNGEVLDGSLRPQGTASQQQQRQPTASTQDKRDTSKP